MTESIGRVTSVCRRDEYAWWDLSPACDDVDDDGPSADAYFDDVEADGISADDDWGMYDSA